MAGKSQEGRLEGVEMPGKKKSPKKYQRSFPEDLQEHLPEDIQKFKENGNYVFVWGNEYWIPREGRVNCKA